MAGEAPTGLFPYRGILISWLLESTLLVAAIVLPAKIASMQPYTPPPLPKYEVIYFSGDELPQTEDLGGAQSGRAGRAGGRHARHRTQAIRVARGNAPSEKIVDAPKLDLPRSDAPVANLLALKRIPGAAPTEGLKSSLASTALPQMSVIPPTPALAHDQMRAAPALTAPVIPPAPQVARGNLRVAGVDPSVVPPAPSGAQREVASMQVPVVRSTDVVPPPVSAPERETSVDAKLFLPAPSVIAPPPAHVTREFGSLGGAEVADLRKQVVPPPVAAGTRSLDKQLAGGLPGSDPVIPPPVESGTRSLDKQLAGGLPGSNTVVPPPVQGVTHSLDMQLVRGLPGGNAVIPPPVQSGPRTLNASPSAVLDANNVVPPPPTLAGTSAGGRGLGNKGLGAGGRLDIGSAVAPPGSGGGSGGGKGIIVSSQPGSKVGIPGSGGSGAMVMSPAGLEKPGLGGSGGGTSIGRGNGPGSGLAGEGIGAAKQGSGRGSDAMAPGGISPFPGPGGVGHRADGISPIPGVDVRGGSTLTLPSFGVGGNDPKIPGHSPPGNAHQAPEISVFGTSRSGGAFNFYDKLKGYNYTTYIPTSAGMVAMQFADANAGGTSYAGDVSIPKPIRTELPSGLGKSRLLIACVLDRSGQFRDIRVLERGTVEMTSKVLAALPTWKFQPAIRNGQPIEVTVFLGFNIDTR